MGMGEFERGANDGWRGGRVIERVSHFHLICPFPFLYLYFVYVFHFFPQHFIQTVDYNTKVPEGSGRAQRD